jgi:drug/metabolite transporter (DMT)-like permease
VIAAVGPLLATLGTVLFAAEGNYGGPNEWGYVLAGWAIAVGGLALYAVVTVVRGRRLAKQLPPEERRWMS